MATSRRWYSLIGILAVFLLANVYVPSMLSALSPRNDFLFFRALFLGGFFAEPTLLAIWCVCSIGIAARRIPTATALLVIYWLAFVGGCRLSEEMFLGEDAYGVGAAAFVIYVLSCAVLWVTVAITKLRIQHPADALILGRGRLQFNLREVFVWTTIVAIIVVLCGLVLPSPFAFISKAFGTFLIWTFLFVLFSSIVAVFFAVSVVPGLFAIFAEDRDRRVVALMALAVGVWIIPLISLHFLGGDSDQVPLLYGAVIGFVVTNCATRGIIRACGYQWRTIPHTLEA